MADQDPHDRQIPVLKDVVVPVTENGAPNTTPDIGLNEQATNTAPSSLLSSTLQAEIDAVVEKARNDFDLTIERALNEMQQRIERELSELHIQLTNDN